MYKTKNELDGDSETGLVPYSGEQVGGLVSRLCGDDAYVNFQDEADVVADSMFPEDDKDCGE